MGAVIKNGLGSIAIDNKAIAQTAALAALDLDGIAGISLKRRKGGRVVMLDKETLSKGVSVDFDDKGVKIGLHLTVDYGTDIPAAAAAVGSEVKKVTEEATGLTVCAVNIYIEGIRTAKQGE